MFDEFSISYQKLYPDRLDLPHFSIIKECLAYLKGDGKIDPFKPGSFLHPQARMCLLACKSSEYLWRLYESKIADALEKDYRLYEMINTLFSFPKTLDKSSH